MKFGRFKPCNEWKDHLDGTVFTLDTGTSRMTHPLQTMSWETWNTTTS